MVGLLIYVLIVCLLLYLIFQFLPLPAPWKQVLMVVIAIIFLIWLLGLVGPVPAHYGRW